MGRIVILAALGIATGAVALLAGAALGRRVGAPKPARVRIVRDDE